MPSDSLQINRGERHLNKYVLQHILVMYSGHHNIFKQNNISSSWNEAEKRRHLSPCDFQVREDFDH